MNGEKIFHSNCKAVELVILIKAGTYVFGLNPMRKAQMGEIILTKYQGLIESIEDYHFLCETVCDGMLKGYKGAKKSLTGETLWWKMEKEMTQVKRSPCNSRGLIVCPNFPVVALSFAT
jgi:hypothetical protein